MYSLLQICTERISLKKRRKNNNDKLNAYLEYALSTAYLVEALFLYVTQQKLVIQLSFVP